MPMPAYIAHAEREGEGGGGSIREQKGEEGRGWGMYHTSQINPKPLTLNPSP
jgi:hypothetical protein